MADHNSDYQELEELCNPFGCFVNDPQDEKADGYFHKCECNHFDNLCPCAPFKCLRYVLWRHTENVSPYTSLKHLSEESIVDDTSDLIFY